MDISFQKIGDKYISEFSVTGTFNLHIEGVLARNVRLLQTTVPGSKYAEVKDSIFSDGSSNVYDCDFPVVVVPKNIKVICDSMPTMAVVTFAS